MSESLQLRAERAEVERRPVNRPAAAADLADLKDRTIEVRETPSSPWCRRPCAWASYSGRNWTNSKPTRADWETRYPGRTWDRMKAAVRNGWERVKH